MKSKAELRDEIMNVKSAEEYQKLAYENGAEISLAEAEAVFEKIKAAHTPEGKSLDNEELDSVSGGNSSKCKATVEDYSWCWSGDQCLYLIHNYGGGLLD